MRILHIGDFHFRSNKNQYEQRNIITKLIEHLKIKPQIDVAIFSGDLVFNGSKKEEFSKAHEILMAPLTDSLNIPRDKVFICSGNHDIDRNECSEAIIDFFSNADSKIKNNPDFDKWIRTNQKDLQTSLQSGKNFFDYAANNFSEGSDRFDEFISVYKKNIDDKTFGIVSLNSSWLCSGFQDDLGNLLFPIEYLKDAIEKIKETDLKIIILHHPLYYFKGFNHTEIQDLIHREFNLMFAGHVHKEIIQADFNSRNGIYCNTTQATLCFDKGEMGYSILNLDIENFEKIKLDRSYFPTKENAFVDLEPVIITIPCGEEKFKQNRLRNKVTDKFDTELEIANQLLLNYNGENKRAFLDTFTNPVLNTTSEAITSGGNPEFSFDFEDLLKYEKNFLIFGKDKCGKTSLLKKIQLHHLKNYSYTGIVPFYIDYKEFDNIDPSKFSVPKEIGKYYGLNNADSNELIFKSKLILLVDNLSIENSIHYPLVEFIRENPSIHFIVCSEYIASRVFLEELDSLEYSKIYIKNLTRKEIRFYTQKQPNIKEADGEVIMDKITNLCSQLQLPLNYWTVSLILLIYKKSNDDYSKNLFSVLDACVDEILNKKRFVFEKTNLKFEQYKIICSQLAHYLLLAHKDSGYAADYSDLISFLDDCIKKNYRIVSSSKEIFDYLFQVGILKSKDDKYTFRLNGIFEYFLAFYIKDNPTFKNQILNEDAIYLSFKNELELYSGFHRNDATFLESVFNKTKENFDPIINKFLENGTTDQNLLIKISAANDFGENMKSLLVKGALKHEIQDQILDQTAPLQTQSEVHAKEFIDTSYVNFELLEKYLSILSRVFKNLDSVENTDLVEEVFDYILTCFCNLGFYFIDEYEKMVKEENLRDPDAVNSDFLIGEEILKLMSRIIPVMIEAMLHDGVGSLNLKRLVEKKIDALKSNSDDNQFKLFLLYFLLIDIDVNAHKEKIDEVFELIHLPPLKVATLFKLNYYLAFKAYKQPRLEDYFKKKIQDAQVRIDDKVDVSGMQKGLANKQKNNLIRRRN